MKCIIAKSNHSENLVDECSRCGSIFTASTTEFNVNSIFTKKCTICNNDLGFVRDTSPLGIHLKNCINEYTAKLTKDYYNK